MNLISALTCLPIAFVLWQGSSCHSANSKMNNNSGARSPASSQKSDVNGVWGGQHINMEVSDTGAEINYDCAHGRITERIVPDRGGHFNVKGLHVAERPGPTREGGETEQPADYSGVINGDEMTLTVKVRGRSEALGSYTLKRGSTGRVMTCK